MEFVVRPLIQVEEHDDSAVMVEHVRYAQRISELLKQEGIQNTMRIGVGNYMLSSDDSYMQPPICEVSVEIIDDTEVLVDLLKDNPYEDCLLYLHQESFMLDEDLFDTINTWA